FTLRGVDHVPLVADVDEAAVRAVLERADPPAARGTRTLVAEQPPGQPDVLDLPGPHAGDAADVEHVHGRVGSVDRPELRPVRRQRETMTGGIRPEVRVPREAGETDGHQQASGTEREDAKPELARTAFGVDA